MKTNNMLLSCFTATVLISFLHLMSAAAQEKCPVSTPHDFKTLAELLAYLQTTNGSNYKLIKGNFDEDTVVARHKKQWRNSCFFNAVGPIIEHLGYSRFVPNSHLNRTLIYGIYPTIRTDPTNWLRTETVDVGYYGSVEDLITHYITEELFIRGLDNGNNAMPDVDFYYCQQENECFFKPNPFIARDPSSTSEICRNLLENHCQSLNTQDVNIDWYFQPGQYYGFAANPKALFPVAWLNSVAGGTIINGGPDNPFENPVARVPWFLNKGLHGETTIPDQVLAEWQSLHHPVYAGCNDARKMMIDSEEGLTNKDIRHVIKAFIDNNTPLLSSVANGDHWVTIVGYADLDSDRLPTSAIYLDSTSCHDSSEACHYTMLFNIDNIDCWNNNNGYSLYRIIPWNQHLDGGCREGGWAAKLDQNVLPAGHKLCDWPAEENLSCEERTYGIELLCTNGVYEYIYHAYPGDPVIRIPENRSCDKVRLRYADGSSQEILNAKAKRYWYDTDDHRWEEISNLISDQILAERLLPGHSGRKTRITWDEAWPEDYWLSAKGLTSPHPLRRTVFTLTSADQQINIEVLPAEFKLPKKSLGAMLNLLLD